MFQKKWIAILFALSQEAVCTKQATVYNVNLLKMKRFIASEMDLEALPSFEKVLL